MVLKYGGLVVAILALIIPFCNDVLYKNAEMAILKKNVKENTEAIKISDLSLISSQVEELNKTTKCNYELVKSYHEKSIPIYIKVNEISKFYEEFKDLPVKFDVLWSAFMDDLKTRSFKRYKSYKEEYKFVDPNNKNKKRNK